MDTHSFKWFYDWKRYLITKVRDKSKDWANIATFITENVFAASNDGITEESNYRN